MGKKQTKTTELAVARASETPSFVVGSFFNGLQIPQESKFDLYQHQANKHKYVLHGESATLEYNGETSQAPADHDYVVAVYDAKSKSVELFKAPLVAGSVTSLENRVHKGPRIRSRGLRNVVKRNALGEAFGTKKAKAAIVNLEKNRIDAGKLQDMEMDIVDNVREYTVALPTRQEMQESSSGNWPTPVADEAATSVEDIYPVEAIIPGRELASIRVAALMEEDDVEKRVEALPYGKSAFVNNSLAKNIAAGSTQKVAMLYYAALLLGVYHNRRVRDKTTLMERLGNKPSELLVDGILERFTAQRTTAFGKSKDRSFVIDPFHEDKLVCHLLALLFHVEGFVLELVPLTHELNMKPTKLVGLFRALGATVKPVGVTMAESLGISKKEAATYKIAVLRVPFKRPEMTRMGGRK